MCHVNSETKLTGFLGYPIKHSLSPLLHNSAYSHLSQNWRKGTHWVMKKTITNALKTEAKNR